MAENVNVSIDLGPVVSAIGALRAEVRAGNERTVEEVRRVAQSAAKTELAKQRAEVESTGPVIERQEDILTGLHKRVDARMRAIEAKFAEVESGLRSSYKKDIRRLGRHIFEILEVEYQAGMERLVNKADFEVFTGRLTQELYQKRSSALDSGVQKARDAARRFVDKRKEFKATLSQVRLEAGAPSKEEFGVPFWVVETKDESGATSLRIIGLSNVAPQSGEAPHYKYGWSVVPQYEQVAALVGKQLQQVAERLSWRDATAAEREAIVGAALDLQGGLSGDLKRIISRELKESPLAVA